VGADLAEPEEGARHRAGRRRHQGKSARIAFLASRTNTMLSIPMLFFMVTGSAHGLPRLF